MEAADRNAIAGAWNTIAGGNAWGFKVASVVNSLPDLDVWIVGDASERTPCLVGLCGSQLCWVQASTTAPDAVETAYVPARNVRVDVSDDFQEVTPDATRVYAATQIRTWTFSVDGRMATVQTKRHPYGDAASGAPDEDWPLPKVEDACRTLAAKLRE